MELFCNFGPDAAPVQKRLRHLKKRRLVPLVPLWAPNAASASLEKKRTSVAVCFAHLGPEHLVTPRLFPI